MSDAALIRMSGITKTYGSGNVAFPVFPPRNGPGRLDTIIGRQNHHHEIDPAGNLLQAPVTLKAQDGFRCGIDRVNVSCEARSPQVFND